MAGHLDPTAIGKDKVWLGMPPGFDPERTLCGKPGGQRNADAPLSPTVCRAGEGVGAAAAPEAVATRRAGIN